MNTLGTRGTLQSIVSDRFHSYSRKWIQVGNFQTSDPKTENEPGFSGPTIQKMGNGFQLSQSQTFRQSIGELFSFFLDPQNLEAITPDRLNFTVLEANPVPPREGTVIRYKLRLRGIPLSWTSEISDFESERYFTDSMIEGPYKRWEHIHTFETINNRTVMGDQVYYELPYGSAGRFAHLLFVKRDLKHIFRHRAQALRKRFGNID